MPEELKQIKKLYGEAMMHFCRAEFASILETRGLLLKLLQDNFAPSHFLYNDLVENGLLKKFKSFIFSSHERSIRKLTKINKTPHELMKKVGYLLYECKTEEDIQNFRKYYADGESLCTFNGGRLEFCHVFFAVKENIDNIKREDFKNPDRQDEYGTSVISIQFSRDAAHTLSIKNRYNHHVTNPDATFGNDLEQIIPGLTDSFEANYGLKQEYVNNGFEIPRYVRANDGKFYKYNYEIYNVYYCPNNVIIDNFEVQEYDKERFIILDYFILDLERKEIYLYDNWITDAFSKSVFDIKKINIINSDGRKIAEITHKNGEITKLILNKYNQIIGLDSNFIREVGNSFLERNITLSELSLPNLVVVGNLCFYKNKDLTNLCLPNLQQVGDDFFNYNLKIDKVDLPKLAKIGDQFLHNNRSLLALELVCLQVIGDSFLYYNDCLNRVFLPKVEFIGNGFLLNNRSLTEIDLPLVQTVGFNFLLRNYALLYMDAPFLWHAGTCFLDSAKALKVLYAPGLKLIDGPVVPCLPISRRKFMKNNSILESDK